MDVMLSPLSESDPEEGRHTVVNSPNPDVISQNTF